MSKELVLQKYNIQKPQEMQKMATVLKDHIVGHKLYTNIQGKNYVHVEGWQFAGGMMGTFPRIVSVQKLADGVWQAEAEIVQMTTQKVISRGFAICSKAESKKKSFDEYAILSMAQTRAIGKAYRNVIGWVMKIAGYEGTPAEEMKSTPTEGNEYEKAVKYVEQAKTEKSLLDALTRVQESEKFSLEEKKALEVKISARIDGIHEKKGKH